MNADAAAQAKWLYLQHNFYKSVFLETDLKISQCFILNPFFDLDNMPIWWVITSAKQFSVYLSVPLSLMGERKMITFRRFSGFRRDFDPRSSSDLWSSLWSKAHCLRVFVFLRCTKNTFGKKDDNAKQMKLLVVPWGRTAPKSAGSSDCWRANKTNYKTNADPKLLKTSSWYKKKFFLYQLRFLMRSSIVLASPHCCWMMLQAVSVNLYS